MFHLFKDVYLDLDQAFTTMRYDTIVMSDRWSKLHFLDPVAKLIRAYDSLQAFADAHTNGDTDTIWSHFYTFKPTTTRLVVYVKPEDYQMMQLQYWKSILKAPHVDVVYSLHKMYTQDRWFKAFFYDENPQQEARDAGRALKIIPYDQFRKIYSELKVSSFLNRMSKSAISFEYLLADYFRDPNSKYAPVVLDKVKKFTWSNWIQELEVLKADLLNGILDVNNVLPDDHQIDTSDPGDLFAQITTNHYLKWIVDPNIHYSIPEYVELTYDQEIFKRLYEHVLNLWIQEDDRPGEDMGQLIDLIYSHRYAELLDRDVARGLGCVYTAGRYRMRANQVFASWIYSVKRSGDLSPLSAYELA
ncbi:hypothetical protein E4H12_13030 [Candidatus Thorarchaeota archaeon]|nr:MAG: hypothetical protein E4H12_13030 [Candidatus Thorarchaeota archaeon]